MEGKKDMDEAKVPDHNPVYARLVDKQEGADRLIGMIAYALYKEEKRDLVVTWRDKKGTYPTKEDMSVFVARYDMNRGFDKLGAEAQRILLDYAEAYMRDQVNEEAKQSALLGEVARVAAWVQPKHCHKKNFGIGVLGSLTASFLIFSLVALLSLFNPDTGYAKVFYAIVLGKGTIVVEGGGQGNADADLAPDVDAGSYSPTDRGDGQ